MGNMGNTINNRVLFHSVDIFNIPQRWAEERKYHTTGFIECSDDDVLHFPRSALIILNNNEDFLKNKQFRILNMIEYEFEKLCRRNLYIEFKNEKDALAFKLKL
jgi:hypothetical protein